MLKVRSLKYNFLMNFTRVLLNMLFPLITFPYAARVLLAEGIGQVNFAQSIISYFILTSGLGIPIYGIRAVAKVRDNKDDLSKLVQELLLITFFATLVNILLFFVLFFSSEKIYSEKALFLVMLSSLILTNLGVEWFYKGIEEFGYITIRNIIFNVISMVLLFLFVREESDYIKYAAILVFSVSGNSILNIINLRKHINYRKKYSLDIRKHIKPIIISFAFILSTGIYVNLSSVLLGYLSGDRAVGLYIVSMKLIIVIQTLIKTLSNVLVPRVSYYIENGKTEKFKEISILSVNFVLLLGLPSIAGLFLFAPEVILIFGGEDFAEAIISMKIMLPLIVIVGFSNFLGIQVLYPFGQEKRVLLAVCIGAVVNLISNMTLIPQFQHIGAAISILLTELIILVMLIFLGKEHLRFKAFNKNSVKYFIATIIMVIILFYTSSLEGTHFANFYVQIIVGTFIYFFILILLKEKFIYKVLTTGRQKLHGKKI